MSTRAVATASEAHVVEAATSLLTRGNAVDAVVAGVFAAAAGADSVLLGPVQLLLGGAGLGLRAVDGRSLQPGKGAPRPRGFTPTDAIPKAAYVAVPVLPAALAAALATSGSATLAQVMAPALGLAEGERKKFLQRLVQRGPSGIADDVLGEELVAAAGRMKGGLLTREDLTEARPGVVAADLRPLAGGRRALLAPWRSSAILDGAEPAPALHTRIVAVVDAKGLLAIACYEVSGEGLDIPELGVRAPPVAAPVLRGATRVKPGERRFAAAPIALSEVAGFFDLALGVAQAEGAEPALGALLSRVAIEGVLEVAQAVSTHGDVLGIARSRTGASLLRQPRATSLPF